MLGFKPKLIPTLFTIPALIILLMLSFWQFQRLHWKQDLIEQIKQQNQLQPISLPEHVDLHDMLYRKVVVKGELLNEFEMHIYGGSRRFKGDPGYYILTPMRLIDRQIVLINRGWVPEKLKEASKRPETLLKGEIEIIGSVMPTEQKALSIQNNYPQRNLWLYINLSEIKEFLQMPIKDFYILAQDNPEEPKNYF